MPWVKTFFSCPSHRDKSHMAWLPLIILFVLKGIFEPFAITPFLQPKWRSCWLLGFCSGLWKAPQAAASRAWTGAINVNSVLNPHTGIHHLSHTPLRLPPPPTTLSHTWSSKTSSHTDGEKTLSFYIKHTLSHVKRDDTSEHALQQKDKSRLVQTALPGANRYDRYSGFECNCSSTGYSTEDTQEERSRHVASTSQTCPRLSGLLHLC